MGPKTGQKTDKMLLRLHTFALAARPYILYVVERQRSTKAVLCKHKRRYFLAPFVNETYQVSQQQARMPFA